MSDYGMKMIENDVESRVFEHYTEKLSDTLTKFMRDYSSGSYGNVSPTDVYRGALESILILLMPEDMESIGELTLEYTSSVDDVAVKGSVTSGFYRGVSRAFAIVNGKGGLENMSVSVADTLSKRIMQESSLIDDISRDSVGRDDKKLKADLQRYRDEIFGL